MALSEVTVYLVVLQTIALLHQPCSGDFLSPFLSPVLNGLCKAVYCGKGICKVSENSTFGFSCQCNPGWTQLHIEEHFRFLPCLIPNCSINNSCTKISGPLALPPFPAPPDNFSLFDRKHVLHHIYSIFMLRTKFRKLAQTQKNTRKYNNQVIPGCLKFSRLNEGEGAGASRMLTAPDSH
ncbi:hypothetical protein KFK09_014568 [Dendrobium nobile]|uniref:EGF-like domain-containing protein n=1 Tax=Dendrobium nobile TaxID=94219 RepID=A0A8T3B2F4_DENNO|nr:hypothetical protein KFK09_014568 [Dendrobium nobile]